MKQLTITLLLGVAMLTACGEKTPDQAASNPPAGKTVPAGTSCYSRQENQDLTVVQLTQEGDKVSGYYVWEPYEKDGAHGSFIGSIKDGMITADHTYMIEGSVQTDEVYFKLDGDNLLEGSGELMEKDGKMVAKSIESLQFTDTLAKTDCANVQEAVSNAELTVTMIKEQEANGGNAEAASLMTDHIIGEWESIDDPKSHVLITSDMYTDIYDGKEMDSDSYMVLDACPESCGQAVDVTCLQVTGKEQRCFTIDIADGENLSLTYLTGTGKPNNYKRVGQ